MQKRTKLFGGNHIQNRLSQSHKTITIGVLGTSEGVGVSHITFALSTYFNKNKNKTACVERNQKPAFYHIEQAYEGLSYEKKEEKFVIKKRTFYKRYKGLLSDVKNGPYQVIIVDFGSVNQIPKEFNDMDVRLIIGHGSEWKMWEYEKIVLESRGSGNHYVLNLGTSEEERLFHRLYKSKAISFPYLKDPFLWTKELNGIVETLLKL